MSMTDPIADLLTRIRNAIAADHEYADIPASKFKTEIARVLDEQGYIEGYTVEPARVGEVLRVKIKYTVDRRSVISGLQRVSRPGRRTYTHTGELPKVLGGMGTVIMSTSRGVMTGHQARHEGVGGELVAYVW
jgi:small subunit ribosomal protein S8